VDKNTVLERAVSGFFQALGWMLGTAVVGVVFAVVAHHPVGLSMGLLVPVLLLRHQWRRRQQQMDIYPGRALPTPRSTPLGLVAKNQASRAMLRKAPVEPLEEPVVFTAPSKLILQNNEVFLHEAKWMSWWTKKPDHATSFPTVEAAEKALYTARKWMKRVVSFKDVKIVDVERGIVIADWGPRQRGDGWASIWFGGKFIRRAP
jgi:hypothetical protein